MTALYTFAVIDAEPRSVPQDLAPLRVVRSAGLGAVVEAVDVADFEGERLERNLADRDWLERAVRHHEGVIESLLDIPAVVPMRFGSIFSSELGLQAMLEENADRFADLLERVRGRQEWGVRICADRTALVRELAPSASQATSGSDYLRRRRAERNADQEVSAVATSLVRDLHDKLADCAESVAILQPRQADARTLLTAAYLVHVSGRQRFLSRAEELASAKDGLTLELSGPWPAYSFTSVDVGGPR